MPIHFRKDTNTFCKYESEARQSPSGFCTFVVPKDLDEKISFLNDIAKPLFLSHVPASRQEPEKPAQQQHTSCSEKPFEEMTHMEICEAVLRKREHIHKYYTDAVSGWVQMLKAGERLTRSQVRLLIKAYDIAYERGSWRPQ